MEIVATTGLLGIERPLRRGDRLLFKAPLTHYHGTRIIPNSNEGIVSGVGDGYVLCDRAGYSYTLTPDNVRRDKPKVDSPLPFISLGVNFRLRY
ncbi:MAG TPA: hypothetical protein VJG66_05045 [Patescibacteria group bacterium]|nr:hypothetical protein [Patescibacteria group bacterium]